eukprot:symbB.v1.2.003335.t1/scaffold172.1/size290804/1
MCHGCYGWRWRRKNLGWTSIFFTSVLLRASEWLELFFGLPRGVVRSTTFSGPGVGSATRTSNQRVLVLGDGDLSYSAALYELQPELRLVATTLESREDLVRRYRLAASHIDALEKAGALVLHEVDATRLVETLVPGVASSERFHRIVFNFPYQVPGGIKDLRRLLSGFLEEAAKLLTVDGVVEVPLCPGQGGSGIDPSERGWAGSWRVPLLAAKASFALESWGPWFW